MHSADGWRGVLEPVVSRYRGKGTRLYFRGDGAFANREIYEFLEVEGMGYAIRLPDNRVLQEKIGYLLKRPVGRPPHEVRRYYASFSYQAQSWKKPRRVVAKAEWHPGELYPRVGFIVTNLARPAERVVAQHNQRGTASSSPQAGQPIASAAPRHPSRPELFAMGAHKTRRCARRSPESENSGR